MLKRRFKKELVFHCQTLKDISDCDGICIVMSFSERNIVISLSEIHGPVFLSLGNLFISQASSE